MAGAGKPKLRILSPKPYLWPERPTLFREPYVDSLTRILLKNVCVSDTGEPKKDILGFRISEFNL